jgi:general L-amino acid transport system substrate-binding protein
MRAITGWLAAALLLMGEAASAQPAATTLGAVKARGELVCGVDGDQLGFSIPLRNGRWIGFDVDYCRAVAAAIFDDPQKVRFVPLSATERFEALRAGRIDILARNTTWTLSRDTALQLNFAAVTYFDGQALMVRREARISSALELSGASVCVERGTTSELNLTDYFRANRMQLRAVVADGNAEMVKAYEEGRCAALTADASALYGERLRLLAADRHVVLPEIISKEPLGPAVRHGDDQWLDIARWVHFAMVTAEELDLESANVERRRNSANPEVRRLLGMEGGQGAALGLADDWAYRVIRRVGNYGESFERNLGRSSPLGMSRRLNGLWTKGGLQYAPPIR